jgi:hypothetical protein
VEAYEMPKHVMFKAIDGRPCTAWPMLSEKAAPMPTGEDRESAFADFPNISTPIDLISVYGRLAYSPIYPLFKQGEIANIKKPEILLDAFGLAPTRTNLNGAKDILASSNARSRMWGYLPVLDCLTMSRDMKALLTVLAFSYGLCGVRALSLNTQHDFAFTYEFEEGESPYGDFLSQVREDDPHVLELDHIFIHEDIQKATEARNGKPASKTLKSMQRFAEGYMNGFMWTVHPLLWGGKFTSMSKAYGLSDIYAYWAQLAAKGKILACANCGKLVANPRKNQMYCSQSCKVQACKRAD